MMQLGAHYAAKRLKWTFTVRGFSSSTWPHPVVPVFITNSVQYVRQKLDITQ